MYYQRLGYRYRLHAKDLPGSPDLVFRKMKIAVFINGCFWHKHEGCHNNRTPKSHREFWDLKLNTNQKRDMENYTILFGMGWKILVIWECEFKKSNVGNLKNKIIDFMEEEM